MLLASEIRAIEHARQQDENILSSDCPLAISLPGQRNGCASFEVGGSCLDGLYNLRVFGHGDGKVSAARLCHRNGAAVDLTNSTCDPTRPVSICAITAIAVSSPVSGAIWSGATIIVVIGIIPALLPIPLKIVAIGDGNSGGCIGIIGLLTDLDRDEAALLQAAYRDCRLARKTSGAGVGCCDALPLQIRDGERVAVDILQSPGNCAG